MEQTAAVADAATQATTTATTQTTDWVGLLLYCVIIFAPEYVFQHPKRPALFHPSRNPNATHWHHHH